jgi:hypothetical protein
VRTGKGGFRPTNPKPKPGAFLKPRVRATAAVDVKLTVENKPLSRAELRRAFQPGAVSFNTKPNWLEPEEGPRAGLMRYLNNAKA